MWAEELHCKTEERAFARRLRKHKAPRCSGRESVRDRMCWSDIIVGMQSSGIFRFLPALLVLLLFPSQVAAQHPSFIEPYEVLYGKPQPLARALTKDKLQPSDATLLLVQARTETILARLGNLGVTLGPNAPQKLQRWAASTKQHRSDAERLRDRGKHYAAWWKASSEFYLAEFLAGLLEALTKEEQLGATDQLPSSRIPEARIRLEGFYARLGVVRVNSVSVALALGDAYSTWVELTSLISLVQNRPSELIAMFEPLGFSIPKAKESVFIRVFVEPLLLPIVQGMLEDAELALQASQADPPTTLVPDEAAIRQIARSYADAARANFALAQSQKEGRTMPDRGPAREFAGRLTGDEVSQALRFERQHRDDSGLHNALMILGVAHDSYSFSLAELDEVQVQLNSQVLLALDKEREMDRLRMVRLVDAEKRAREATAQARAAIGLVPTMASLAYARGQELHEGDSHDRELALTELANARTFAELAAGLGAKTPRDAVASEAETTSEGETNQRLVFVACIEKLRMEKTAQATGFLRKRAPDIQDADLRNLIDAALMKACTRARSLDESVGPLFWTVLKNGLADWYREVAVFERAAPKLTADCDSEPPQLDDLLGREQCDLLKQGMSQLSSEEKRLISLKFDNGMTYEQIGALLNIKPGTARKRVDRILERLRSFFRDRDALTLYWLWLQRGLPLHRPAILPSARLGIA